MPRPEWRDPAKERYWRRLLGQWRRSGQTGRDFCAEQELSEPSFYAWKREIARRDQEGVARSKPRPETSPRRSATAALPAFLPVTMAAAASASPALEIVLPHGRVLRVRPGFDAEVLRQLLAVLEEPSC
jgi:transposase